jgi:DNA polymerase-3 subunit alpha
VIFVPGVCPQWRPRRESDSVVLVSGRYYVNEDEKKVFAERIEPLTPNPVAGGKLFLRVCGCGSPEEMDPKQHERVIAALTAYPGNIPALLYFEKSKKFFTLKGAAAVRRTKGLETELSACLGAGNFHWRETGGDFRRGGGTTEHAPYSDTEEQIIDQSSISWNL